MKLKWLMMFAVLIAGVLLPPALRYLNKSTNSSFSLQVLHKLHDNVAKSDYKYDKIAVGYNTNLDLIVKAKNLLLALNLQPTDNTARQDHERINSESDLLETFTKYFSQGSAVERFIENNELCDRIMRTAAELPQHQFHIGGNAGLMGQFFATASTSDVLLGGAIGDRLSALLSNKLTFKLDEAVKEEIHLIMEYENNEAIGSVTSSRANRMILHCDKTNSQMKVLEEFHKQAKEFGAELQVISGLHLLESESSDTRVKRLQVLAEHLTDNAKIPRDTPVHLELASIGDATLMRDISTLVVPHVDSLGINEQELGSLYNVLSQHDTSSAIDKNVFKDPSVITTLRALSVIFKHYKGVNTQGRALTRIHFHYLKYHVVAQRRDIKSEFEYGWKSGNTSVAAGSYAATTQACEVQSLDHAVPEKFDLQFPSTLSIAFLHNTHGIHDARAYRELEFSPSSPVMHVYDDHTDVDFYISPVVICKKPTKTVGLGDSISSSGLLHHQFVKHEKN